MLKVIEATAKSVEEATRSALAQLGCAPEEATVEVLERGKSGFLGIGAVPAKVRKRSRNPPRHGSPRPRRRTFPERRRTSPPKRRNLSRACWRKWDRTPFPSWK